MNLTTLRGKEHKNSNTLIQEYTVGKDYILDMELLPYDLQGSCAHVQMLAKIGIINEDEEAKIIDLLVGENEASLLQLYIKGMFSIHKEQEDGHTAIESYLTEKLGDIGKKIHTGRSRNDQILVTLRLFTLDTLTSINHDLLVLIETFSEQSKKHKNQIMPGYTHTQKAMPSTVGMWLGSFADALSDDIVMLNAAKEINNQNPLGSAAGFGQKQIAIDRAFVTDTLGFQKTQENPMYCALSRGKFENIVLQALGHIMGDIGKFANDMLWFSSQEFGFFDLPDSYKTGSSIMPNKHNFDVLEIIRGNVSIFHGYQMQIQQITQGLFSGYNRDLQLTKEPYLKGIALVIDTIQITKDIVSHIIVNKETLQTACSGDIYATEKTYELVKKGVPFREAYQQIKDNLDPYA